MKDLEEYNDFLNHDGDAPEGDQLAKFLQESAKAEIPAGRGKQAIWDSIAAELEDTSDEEPPVKKLNPWVLGGIAASVLLLVVFVLGLQSSETNQTVHIVAESGADLVHELPDGSIARLNASTSILYDEDWDRFLTLSGEAFFEVTKGSTFTVKTRFGSVEVLGTSFNVYARDSVFEVSCKTGKVKVSIPEQQVERELVPGEKLAARVDTVFKTSLRLEEIGTWTTGEFYFSNRPLREVLDEIERQYKTTIDIRNGDSLRFTGYFFREADLASTLDLICLPLGLQFEKQEERYVISQPSEEL